MDSSNEIAARRALRRDQGSFLNLMNDRREELVDMRSNFFRNMHQKFRAIGGHAKHTRELQNDAIALHYLSSAVHKQAQFLGDFSSRFDFSELVSCIKDRFGGRNCREFPWLRLEKEATTLFTGAQSVRPLLGVLGKEIPVRTVAARAPRSANDDAAEQPKHEEIVLNEDENELEVTNQRIHVLFDCIKSKGEEGVDLLRMIVDPISTVQSIENMFDLGFLIKVRHREPHTAACS